MIFFVAVDVKMIKLSISQKQSFSEVFKIIVLKFFAKFPGRRSW